MTTHNTLDTSQVDTEAIESMLVTQPTETKNKKKKKALGLPMEYVEEDTLDKMAGSIRIKL